MMDGSEILKNLSNALSPVCSRTSGEDRGLADSSRAHGAVLSRVRSWWDTAPPADLSKRAGPLRPRADPEAEDGAGRGAGSHNHVSSGGRVGPWGHRKPGVPKLQGGERGTCHGEPAGPAERRGPPPSEQFGGAGVGNDGASAGGQAQGQSAEAAPGQPHHAGQELGQAPQAFHGAGARRRELLNPSPSCRTVARRPALRDPAPAPELRPRHTEHAPARRACV